jgi:hypothetical protein
MGPEHEFQLLLIKKQAEECNDIKLMRQLLLQTVEMMEAQRKWLMAQLEAKWFNKPGVPEREQA